MSIKVLIDSASDISQTEADELGVALIPMIVNIDGKEYYDGINLLPKEFYKKFRELSKTPLTKGKMGGILTKLRKERGALAALPSQASKKTLKIFQKGIDKREESEYNRKAVRCRRWIGRASVFEN